MRGGDSAYMKGKPDQMMAFDAMYQIASAEGRGEALFGDSIGLAREAYERTLIGDGYPNAYLEFPLIGKPGFDILSVHACGDVHAGDRFARGAGFGRQAMFDWLAGIGGEGDVSCGLELDTSSGEVETAGVYLQFRDHRDLIAPFLDSIGEGARLPGYSSQRGRDQGALQRGPEGSRRHGDLQIHQAVLESREGSGQVQVGPEGPGARWRLGSSTYPYLNASRSMTHHRCPALMSFVYEDTQAAANAPTIAANTAFAARSLSLPIPLQRRG